METSFNGIDYDDLKEADFPVPSDEDRKTKAGKIGGRLSPAKLTLADRRTQAFAKRLEGKSFEVIASELGMSVGGAWKCVSAAFEMARQNAVEDCSTMLALECARLDEIMRAHWSAAIGRDPKSTDVVLKTIEMRIKLLGLAAPERTEVKTVTESSSQTVDLDLLNLSTECLEEIVAAIERQQSQQSKP